MGSHRRLLLVVSLLVSLLALPLGCGSSGSHETAAPRTLAYAALGASDAVGIGASPLSSGYVFLLEERLQGLPATVTFLNAGISGARVEEIIERELPRAVEADPDVLTLWTGANDMVGGADPDLFAGRLDTLLAELKAKTRAQVFVGDLPDLTTAPMFRSSPDPDVTPARVQAFNEGIASVVAANGCVLVKLSERVLTDDMFWFDGFHPNNAGYVLLADAYWAEIAPTL